MWSDELRFIIDGFLIVIFMGITKVKKTVFQFDESEGVNRFSDIFETVK